MTQHHTTKRFESLAQRVGNTPIVYWDTYRDAEIWVKLESKNPSWSLKDRHTLWILNELKRKNELIEGKTIIDTSSGSYARSIALFGRSLGFPVKIILKKSIDDSFLRYLTLMGAEAVVSNMQNSNEGREECLVTIKENPGMYIFTDQMGNAAAAQAHYDTTGPEIMRQVPDATALVISMGSGATVNGVGRYLADSHPSVPLFANVSGDTSRGKFAGSYEQGDYFSPFITEIRAKKLATEIPVDYEAGIESARELVRSGLDVGATAGGTLQALKQAIETHNLKGKVVMLAGDSFFPNIKKFL